jgi:hypothetical protein
MSSTYSSYKFELIGTGDQAGTWGSTTNTNLGTTIEQAIGGYVSVAFTGTTKTLTLTNSNAVQDARALYLNLTGAPGGAAVLEVPAIQKAYIIKNATTGGFTVTAKVTGLTGVDIPNGKTMLVYNNGTDVVLAHDNFSAPVTINANSSSDALRINQLNATGNALVVEDETNPDSTPFVINASGAVLSGTTTARDAANAQSGSQNAAGRVAIHGLTTQLSTQFQGAWSATAAAVAPALVLGRSKGTTVGDYTAVVSADILGYMSWQGSDGAKFVRSADIRVAVDGTVGLGIVPGVMYFRTADSTGTLAVNFSIGPTGNIGITGAPSTSVSVSIAKNITGNPTNSYGVNLTSNVAVDVTGSAYGYFSQVSTDASVTLTNLHHFRVAPQTFGVGSAVTNQFGVNISSTMTGATNNYGFYSELASATGVWGFYGQGDASNYMAGALAIGLPIVTGYNLNVSRSLTGAITSSSIANTGYVASDVTSTAYAYESSLSATTTAHTLGALVHYGVTNPTKGAGTTINAQYGFFVSGVMNAATNNYGFWSGLDSATGVWGFYEQGTADNAFAGNTRFGAVTAPVATVDVTGSVAATTSILSSGATSGVGYATGAGGAVTQLTSRVTGVTLNKTTGAITLVSAAGSATYQSFTVTNSAAAATDVIIVNQKSGTDKYIIMVTAVAAGSFQITFATTGGTTTEQPVFNFAVIKGVAA